MTDPLRYCSQIIILIHLFCLVANRPLFAATPYKQELVPVYHNQINNKGYEVFADNNLPVPVFVRLNFDTLQNCKADKHLPVEIVLPAKAKRVELVKLTAGKGKKHQFTSSYNYSIGNPINTKPDAGHLYLFPFVHGSKFKVGQGFNGKTTHFGQNQYAIDFDMPEGTPVCAARDGIVAEIKQDSDVNGDKPEYNNYLLVYHSDGTIGDYSHLKQSSVKVRVGDHVNAGDVLSFSGNTGFSSGPHLHFDVRIPLKNGTRQTIPIKFLNHDRSPTVPVVGLYYYALHHDKDKFKVALGRTLRNEDYRLWLVNVSPISDKAEIRIETIDDTKIVFIRNSSTSAIDAEVRLDLNNMLSSNGNLVKIRVQAQSELFVTLLNPDDLTKPAQFTSSLAYTYKH